MSPNVTIDWAAPGGPAVTLPVGLGVSRLFTIGQLPVEVGAEV
jgi:hypothetical protein